MSTPSPTSPQRRPRLSLQIKAIANGPSGRTSRTLAAAVDVKSPTAFNTLSNVYATAVDRSTPVTDKPPANALSGAKPTLRLQTQDSTVSNNSTNLKARGAHTPYLGPYLDTPLSAQPQSPAMVAKDVRFPSSMTMTATPPLSAVEQTGNQSFEGATTTPMTAKPVQTPQTPGGARRRTTMPATLNKPPYTHTRSLRSILRNSPLPPLSTKSPISPRRQSVRLQEKAARRVAYNSPLCQTITTSKYTISHIDLLAEDQTPTTPSQSENGDLLDQTMAYTGNETRDGGQTPGPFEEMRRRMAGLHASTPTTAPTTPISAGGIRKRGAKKKEKKRRWVWTIGNQEGEDEDGSPVGVVTPPVAATPAPIVLVAMPVPKAAGVPVLAVPAPRPRTRMQMQMTMATAAPVAASNPPAASRATTTPEPVTAVFAPEPPTPSLSVGSSTADPVFEPRADVEMSDASSMFSEDENQTQKPDAMMGDEMGDEMDTDTPVTAQRVVFQEANRGWGQAPWIASSG